MSLLNLNTPYETKRIITYHSDGIRAIYKNKELQHVIGNIYKDKEEKDQYSYESCNIYCYYENISLGINMGGVGNLDSVDIERLLSNGKQLKTETTESFISDLEERIVNVQHIGNAQIELASHIRPDRVGAYIQARLDYRQKKDEEYEVERLLKEAKEKEEADKKQAEIDSQITECERLILAGERAFNKTIELLSGTETSLILLLLKRHNINVPLKTQGWINQALHSLKIIRDKYSYDYFNSSRNSTVFQEYLDKLVLSIKEKAENNT
jgi:hypothetical protein